MEPDAAHDVAAAAPQDGFIARPAHLAPHGPSPFVKQLVDLYESCIKKKIDIRRKYLANWMAVSTYLAASD